MNAYKIFGIGLSRTGTASLHSALLTLGYSSIHNPKLYILRNNELHFYPKAAHYYDTMVDAPVAAFYKNLDDIFCDSKFILTIRDIDEWLNSCEKFFSLKSFESTIIPKLFSKIFYGSNTLFDKDKYIKGYYKHLESVKDYFKNRKDDLLILDICGGDGWEKLCPFLEKEIPNEPFPHENKYDDCKEIDKKICSKK